MIFDYIYANIYNWYNRMAQNGRNVDPQHLTSLSFGICVCGWALLSIDIYNKVAGKNIDISKLFYGFLSLLASGIVSLIYSKNDRYQKVYDKFITSNKIKNRAKAILISFIFIFFPLILYIVMIWI